MCWRLWALWWYLAGCLCHHHLEGLRQLGWGGDCEMWSLSVQSSGLVLSLSSFLLSESQAFSKVLVACPTLVLGCGSSKEESSTTFGSGWSKEAVPALRTREWCQERQARASLRKWLSWTTVLGQGSAHSLPWKSYFDFIKGQQFSDSPDMSIGFAISLGLFQEVLAKLPQHLEHL